jgi:hypothetical protein
MLFAKVKRRIKNDMTALSFKLVDANLRITMIYVILSC